MIISVRFTRLALVAVLAATLLFQQVLVYAGHFGFRGGAVGGISVNAEGVVREAEVAAQNQLRAALEKELKKAPGDMNHPVQTRFISLKGLNAALAQARAENLGQIPDELKYLGGLTRIQYVLAYPEQNDIVIGGPAEGWKLDEKANVVGVTSGRPMIPLDDLLVAFRCVHRAREEGITCSIDPTQDGLQKYHKVQTAVGGQFSNDAVRSLQEAIGAFDITVKGVPENSHFARVLVAADYHMKRIAMKLDPSPVNKLPSYMDMIKNGSRATNAMPRWWLACNYDPLLKSEDGLTWEIRGQGVKCLTEDDIVNADGTIKHTGKAGAMAQKWADTMTAQYNALSGKNLVFGELRNIMDLCVVAALIEKEGLAQKVGLSIPLLTDPTSELTTLNWPVPRKVAAQVSLVKASGGILMTTSGGVQVDSWLVASNAQVGPEVAAIREKAGENNGKVWWWQ